MRTYMKSYMSRIKFHIKDKDVFKKDQELFKKDNRLLKKEKELLPKRLDLFYRYQDFVSHYSMEVQTPYAHFLREKSLKTPYFLSSLE